MDDDHVRRCRPLLGTFVEIVAPGGSEEAVEAAFARIAHIHARMSFHEETSDLAMLRRAPAETIVAVDPMTVEVLSVAADLFARSDGLFDVSIGADLAADGFLPMPSGLAPGKAIGTARDIRVVDAGHVRCMRPVLIDLGGIAKGFAVDCAVQVLSEAGIRHAVVNAGGDLRVLGDRAETVYLREVDGTIAFSLVLADAALASSGDIGLVRAPGGKLASPYRGRGRTPIPVRTAVSVVAERCVIADAMTKIALADPALAATMIRDLGGEIVVRPPARAAA